MNRQDAQALRNIANQLHAVLRGNHSMLLKLECSDAPDVAGRALWIRDLLARARDAHLELASVIEFKLANGESAVPKENHS